MSKEPLFVTCPVCGKVNQKSLFTYSEVRCQRCHRELTAFADLGVVVGIDMNKKRSKEEVDRLEMYNEFVGPFLSCGGDSWWNYIMQVRNL